MIVAFQIDPLRTLNEETDSSLLLMKEFINRGYQVFCFTPADLYTTQKGPCALGSFVDSALRESIKSELELSQTRAIFIRQDPPFNMDYITSLYLLKLLEPTTMLINSPDGIMAWPEKISALKYKGFIPSSIITNNTEQVLEFIYINKQAVLKPLYGYGGADIEVFKGYTKNLEAQISDYLAKHKYAIAQEFIPQVKEGDKRVIIIDGQVLGSIKRVPAEGSIKANIIAGGVAKSTNLSTTEQKICEQVGGDLKKDGIFMAGIDLLAERLIEINVTSPTGLASINKLYNRKTESEIVSVIEKRLNC